MFLRDERVESLEVYLAAYAQARADLGFKGMTDEDLQLVQNFNLWLANKLNWHANVSWLSFVRRADSGPRNVHTFFRLLEEFLAKNGTSLDEIEPWQHA